MVLVAGGGAVVVGAVDGDAGKVVVEDPDDGTEVVVEFGAVVAGEVADGVCVVCVVSPGSAIAAETGTAWNTTTALTIATTHAIRGGATLRVRRWIRSRERAARRRGPVIRTTLPT